MNTEATGKELDELAAMLTSLMSARQAGFNVWRHRMNAGITELAGGKSALAIQFNGLDWSPPANQLRLNNNFVRSKQEAVEIIESLRWELSRKAPEPNPVDDAAIDPELWGHVQVLIDAGDWDKVALNTAVFVEDKLRVWAQLPSTITGSVNVFNAALAPDQFLLGDSSSEQQGWQQLGRGFALALRNRSGHRVDKRSDAKRYALGVLGLGSLLLTEIKSVYGDPPQIPPPSP